MRLCAAAPRLFRCNYHEIEQTIRGGGAGGVSSHAGIAQETILTDTEWGIGSDLVNARLEFSKTKADDRFGVRACLGPECVSLRYHGIAGLTFCIELHQGKFVGCAGSAEILVAQPSRMLQGERQRFLVADLPGVRTDAVVWLSRKSPKW